MATYLHFAPAVALAVAVGPRAVGWPLTLLGALVAVMPDADFLLVWLRFDTYSGTYGHRGFTHSLGFALAVGLIGACWPRSADCTGRRRGVVGLYLALCTASHPLLDGVLDAGICNAWWWPLDGARHCLAWRPVPMRTVALFGWARLGAEALWIGVPLVLLANAGMLSRALRRRWAPTRLDSAPVDVGTLLGSAEGQESTRRMQRRRRMLAMQGLALALQTHRPAQQRKTA